MNHRLITQITWDDKYWSDRAQADDLSQRAMVLSETDPVSGRITITVYSDDGAGNGLPIFSFPLN